MGVYVCCGGCVTLLTGGGLYCVTVVGVYCVTVVGCVRLYCGVYFLAVTVWTV